MKGSLFGCAKVLMLTTTLNSAAQVQFEEMSGQIGVQHMHRSPKQLGGGVAVFDYDNDGWEDVYLTGGLNGDKLLHNLGNGLFEDVSAVSGISSLSSHYTFGVTTGDIDNDGYRDILVTTEAGFKSILWRNQGNGTFVHLPNAINDGMGWKSAASFGDVNLDGLLDVYITAYVYSSSFIYDSAGGISGFSHDCDPNLLFINNGDLTFTNVTAQYGVNDEGCALAVAFTDFDNDLDLDLMLANDFGAWVEPSALFENEFPVSQLSNISPQSNMDLEIYGMGVAIGDYDKDGDLDYYQTNLGRNVLSRNDGWIFTDVTTQADCENDSTGQLLNTGWGTFFFDADNDSWPDLFVANGVISAAELIANLPLDPNKLYLNNADGTFSDISDQAGVSSVLRGRGAAYGDFDNDGRLDFLVNNIHKDTDSTHYEYYRNVSTAGNWVSFKLIGNLSNRDAFGSHVRLVNDGISALAEVDGGSSHASQNTSVVHFGLGSAQFVDSVVVVFPSGVERVLTAISANQRYIVYEDLTVETTESLEMKFKIDVSFDGSDVILVANEPVSTELEIFDISGRSVSAKRLSVSSGINKIKLAELSSGIYLVRLIIEGKQIQVTKVIVGK